MEGYNRKETVERRVSSGKMVKTSFETPPRDGCSLLDYKKLLEAYPSKYPTPSPRKKIIKR